MRLPNGSVAASIDVRQPISLEESPREEVPIPLPKNAPPASADYGFDKPASWGDMN